MICHFLCENFRLILGVILIFFYIKLFDEFQITLPAVWAKVLCAFTLLNIYIYF